jgi:ABC-type lipoprotein export system ATPase subunit
MRVTVRKVGVEWIQGLSTGWPGDPLLIHPPSFIMQEQIEIVSGAQQNGNGRSQGGSLISIRHLEKVYETAAGRFKALNGVNLDIQKGEFVAILGKSGAGKSTLINMITGIDRPTTGGVIVDGTPLHAMDEDALARWRGVNMGIVFQFFQLIPSLTLIENITLPMDFCGTYPLEAQEGRALELLDSVGIAGHGNKKPSKISGGQQQRVAIARALANNPDLVIADEPTGNLDSATASGVLNIFSGLVREGKTLVVATHDREVAGRASRVIEIADGCIVGTDCGERAASTAGGEA